MAYALYISRTFLISNLRRMKMNYSIKDGKADKAFFNNIIVPDAALLIIGLTTSFGTLLALFS